MTTNKWYPSSECPRCHSASAPAARTKCFRRGDQSVACLTFVWSCLQCGHEFVDEVLLLHYGHEQCGTPSTMARRRSPPHNKETTDDSASSGTRP